MAVIKNNRILKCLLMMVVSLLLVLNFSIGVFASSGYNRQDADACITISERLTVKGGSGTTSDIYSFGNKSSPRGARPMQDFGVESFDSIVGPEHGPLPKGASNVLNVNDAPLNGHYHILPAGTQMPDGLDIVADGIDVVPNSPHGVGHHTIFPTREMTVNEFNELFKSLPWQYGGKK